MNNGSTAGKGLVVLGTGVLARLATSYFGSAGRGIAAYTEEAPGAATKPGLNAPVVALETLARTHPPDRFELFVAVGNRDLNAVRQRLIAVCRGMGYDLASYVHPSACVSPEAVIQGNCLVLEQCIVGPCASVGEGSLLFAGSLVNHDCVLESCCYLSSARLGGFVHVGARSFLGISATVRDCVRIGPDCLVGAGALVLEDIPAQTFIKAQASPGRPLIREKAFQFSADQGGPDAEGNTP